MESKKLELFDMQMYLYSLHWTINLMYLLQNSCASPPFTVFVSILLKQNQSSTFIFGWNIILQGMGPGFLSSHQDATKKYGGDTHGGKPRSRGRADGRKPRRKCPPPFSLSYGPLWVEVPPGKSQMQSDLWLLMSLCSSLW